MKNNIHSITFKEVILKACDAVTQDLSKLIEEL